jgi:hypothetical protein
MELSMNLDFALSLPVITPAPWVADWLWGLPLIAVTVTIHVFGLLLIDKRIAGIQRNVVEHYGYAVVFMLIIGGTAILAAVLHGIEGAMWAAAYRIVGALPDYRDSVLYSLGAMTTYGHSEMILEKQWRLMGDLEALDGMLLFGLTTAFLFGIIQRARDLRSKH